MAADSGSDADDRENDKYDTPKLVNGDSVTKRLDKIEFNTDNGNSVVEIREQLNLDS